MLFLISYFWSFASSYLKNNEVKTSSLTKSNKNLIVYFSCTGNTKRVANNINSIIGGDLIEIIPKVPYTTEDLNYNDANSRSSLENKNQSILPEISNEISNFEEYQTIFIGYPIWHGRSPNIIFTLLKKYDFNNKNIITFSTSSSSSDSSASILRPLAPNSNWNSPFQRFPSSASEATIKNWIDSLNLDLNEPNPETSSEDEVITGTDNSDQVKDETVTIESISNDHEQDETATKTESNDEGNDQNRNKILIVYFSCTGNTKRVANNINSIIGGDLIEIIPKVPYTTEDLNYNDANSRSSLENKNQSILPEISNEISNFEEYQTIFIGYPIWHGRSPNIIFTLLKKYDFNNKNIITFSTSSSSSDSSASILRPLAPNSNWNSPFQRFPSSASEAIIKNWIDSLNINFHPPQTNTPTQSRGPPPTKPPVESKDIDLSDFETSNGKVTIDVKDDKYETDVLYNIQLTQDITEVDVDMINDKLIAFILPPESREITIDSTDETPKSFDIIPQAEEVTINLGVNTRASLQNAKGKVTINNNENKAIQLNSITPQSSDFTLISKIPTKINEVDFIGQQGLNVQSSSNNNVEVGRMKIQSNSEGTINNLKVNNIVFGTSSCLNIAANVDMSESSIDLAYNDVPQAFDSKAPLSGDLTSVPNAIILNKRGSHYFEETQETFLIAESSDNKFDCNKWADTFNKGPFNTKFNNAQCKIEYNNGVQVMRLYAFQSTKNDDKKGLKPPAIAGIVIGVVIVVVVIVVVIVYFLVIRKKKSKLMSDKENSAEVDEV